MLCEICGNSIKGQPGLGINAGLYTFYICSCGAEWEKGPWDTYEDIERELVFTEGDQNEETRDPATRR